MDEQYPDVAMSVITQLHFPIHTYKWPFVYILRPRQLLGNVLHGFVYGFSFEVIVIR